MGDLVGGLVSGIIGNRGAKKQAAASQAATDAAVGAIQPFRDAGVQAQNVALGGLGVGGTAASDAAFENFLNSTGFRRELQTGSDAIAASRAARGLLDSGATGKALTSFGQDLAQSRFQNFLGQLNAIANRGASAAGQIGQIGQAGGIAAADRRFVGQAGLANAAGNALGGVLPRVQVPTIRFG